MMMRRAGIINKIFFDTSVLVEYLKGNSIAVNLLTGLQEISTINGFINDIVVSEFLFHYISIKSNLSPFTIKKNGTIKDYITYDSPKDFLDQFNILTVTSEIIDQAYDFMGKYNFLPNDAIILATCIIYEIKFLISLDNDFENACKLERIQFISNSGGFEVLKNKNKS